MESDELQYCLSKKIGSIQTVNTNYGEIELDDEMKEAVKSTLERILERRLAEMTE